MSNTRTRSSKRLATFGLQEQQKEETPTASLHEENQDELIKNLKKSNVKKQLQDRDPDQTEKTKKKSPQKRSSNRADTSHQNSKRPKKAAIKVEVKVEEKEIEDTAEQETQVKTSKGKKKQKQSKNKTIKKEDSGDVNGAGDEVKSRKRATKSTAKSEKGETGAEVKEEANKDMAGAIVKGGKFVGAHMSVAGGLWNAVSGAETVGAKSFALFLRSQRQWNAKPLEDEVANKFREAYQKAGFHPDHILPHGSYLLNCGSPNPETLRKSRESLLDEISRCEKLGLTRYNFHPGSTCGEIPVEECLDKIAESINMVLDKTVGVMAVIENMSCQGNTIGGKFEEIRGIIDRVKDKSRVGVCLDTCHAFAAGHDLSTEDGYQKMTDDFEKVIGFQYLKAVHLNDSKGKVGCHLDRHENIGKGFIGLKGFKRLMNDPRFNNIPMVLETPPGVDDGKEIKLLYSLIDTKK